MQSRALSARPLRGNYMKWEDRGRSRNLEDRRGSRGPGRAIGGGAIPLGIGGVILVLVISALTGVDLSTILGTGTGPTTSAPPPSQQSLDAEEEQVRFVSFVLDDVQAFWSETFRVSGVQYPEAQLVLYRDAVQSGCGVAPAAAGPFYCPADQKVYLDLARSEERRVGKECRSRWSPDHEEKKEEDGGGSE